MRTLVPTTTGLANGLTEGFCQLQTGVNDVGKFINCGVNGVDDIAGGAVVGLGNTLQKLPKSLYDILAALGKSTGLVSSLLNTLC